MISKNIENYLTCKVSYFMVNPLFIFRKLMSVAFAKTIFDKLKPYGFTVEKIFNWKPFGKTIKEEINTLIMEIIHQVLRDYNLKRSSK